LYKSTVYISDEKLRQTSEFSQYIGLYNYTVSYINTAYISL